MTYHKMVGVVLALHSSIKNVYSLYRKRQLSVTKSNDIKPAEKKLEEMTFHERIAKMNATASSQNQPGQVI